MATRSSSSGTTKGKSTPRGKAAAPDGPLRVVAAAAPAPAEVSAAITDTDTDAAAMPDSPETAAAPAAYGRRDLVARVVEMADVRKRDARPVIEATLAALAEALAGGKALNLPPLGKLSVNRSRAEGGVLMLKLRRPGLRKPADAPLADLESDG